MSVCTAKPQPTSAIAAGRALGCYSSCGGHPAVDIPAVRRHQRDLLLFDQLMTFGRLQRGQLPHHHNGGSHAAMSVVVTLIAIVDKARRKPMLLEGVPTKRRHTQPRRQ